MAEEILTMQQEAVRRAKEMHSRARPFPAQPQPEPKKEIPKNPPPAPTAKDESPDLFESFFKDKEKMLILALLVILSQEECDNGLLFSLMFLLL
ncbi:MAG: hypothetical protein RSC76_00380 [Oscillospiraceae bacterium]